MGERTPAMAAMWREFRVANPEVEDRYDAYAFGAGAEMADRLLDLVLHGPKRATAGLARWFIGEHAVDRMPEVGDHCLLLDGSGQPRCVVRTTDVQVKPLNQVDAQFAWDEGEGDRSLEYWMRAHRDFFSREAEQHGFTFHDDIETVLERFTVVWPPEIADDVH